METKMEMTGRVLSGEEAAKHMEGIIHEGKQVKSRCIDLTLKEVYILEGSGDMDFSGNESKEARRKKHPLLRKEGDPYGWWTLGHGQYVIEYNEKMSLPEGSFALVSPKPRLVANEAFHPTMVFNQEEDLGPTTLTVGPPGINLKQNARISRVSIFQ